MPMGYADDFPDPVRVDMYYDEITALIVTVCDKWGYTEGERYANKMPAPLHPALAALYESVEVYE